MSQKNLSKKLEKEILEFIEDGNLKKYTPSLQIEVYLGGQKKISLKMGPKYRYYDLASLTKIIFTVPAMMQACDLGLLNINHPVKKYLPWWPHSSTKIKNVLSHSASLPWWAPYYKKLKNTPPAIRRESLLKILKKTPLVKSQKAVYSDVDFILLGFLLEAVYKKPLLEIWQNLNWRKRASSLHFNPSNKPKYKRSLYAPTERCPWRKRVLRGEVHDDNTWSFGGVSSHAGLFGQIEDVSRYGLLLRQGFIKKTKSHNHMVNSKKQFGQNELATPKTIRKFVRRAIPSQRGDWALGYMLPSQTGSSSGKYLSRKSVGHTGFTGTSLWYDPHKDILITILSHRVHPTRKNRRFVALRPILHDMIIELLFKKIKSDSV